MIKFVVRTTLSVLVLAGAHPAFADEGRKLPTIGLAIPVDAASDAPFQKAFRDGLRDLGYVDGKNVTMVVRYSNGDPAKYNEIIRELIALHVDVLWGEARELKEATTTIPIVSPTMDWGDPVRTGLIASRATGWQPHRSIKSTQRHRSKTTAIHEGIAPGCQTPLSTVRWPS